jgi:DNA-binding CsgD family transcriptional regulator
MGERAMNLRRCTHWTAREDEMLICMVKNGASSAMIAQKLGRTAEGVYQRRRRLRKSGVLPAAFHYGKNEPARVGARTSSPKYHYSNLYNLSIHDF